jgi:hypothetical protein
MISMRVGLAWPSNFSFFPSSNYYLLIRHRSPTLRYSSALFGPLHLTGEEYGKWIFDATQNILLDVVASEQGLLRTFNYPDYITDEVWELLGDVLEVSRGPSIDTRGAAAYGSPTRGGW